MLDNKIEYLQSFKRGIDQIHGIYLPQASIQLMIIKRLEGLSNLSIKELQQNRFIRYISVLSEKYKL